MNSFKHSSQSCVSGLEDGHLIVVKQNLAQFQLNATPTRVHKSVIIIIIIISISIIASVLVIPITAADSISTIDRSLVVVVVALRFVGIARSGGRGVVCVFIAAVLVRIVIAVVIIVILLARGIILVIGIRAGCGIRIGAVQRSTTALGS